MGDRRRDVVLLLGSRFDGLYLPSGSLVSPAGLVPAEVEPCRSCGGVLLRDDFGKVLRRAKGRGWVFDRFRRRQPCSACGGFQDERGRWHGGEVARDPMDALGVRIGSVETVATARPRRTVACESCEGEGAHGNGRRCGVCRGEGRRDLHLFELRLDRGEVDAEPDPLGDAIEARNQSGSYAELEQALAGIRVHVNKPVRFHGLTVNATTALRLLDELYLPPAARSLEELEPGERELVDLAVAYIVWRMPDPIRVPAEVRANAKVLRARRTRARGRASHPRALEQRAKEWRQWVRDGRSPQWIAAEYGVAVSTVYDVLKQRAC